MVHLKFFKHFLILEVLFASLFLPFSNFLYKLSIVSTVLNPVLKMLWSSVLSAVSSNLCTWCLPPSGLLFGALCCASGVVTGNSLRPELKLSFPRDY